ncbi:MAG TPA: thiamine pyrophosphate-dependent dehydrogenase E1 component subunit alpha [Gaiellaceae bacterium]|nr:thiamine pyrophosphate-dependent dehydrogenase E1 component subunit alpha [Gaiellaceae bacterium]
MTSDSPQPGESAALEDLYYKMALIRAFDRRVVELFDRRLIRGSAHPYIGMEAIAVGVCAAIDDRDYITSTHRGHGHCLARGLDPGRMMAEILGRETGYCRGKGGSMHITAMEHGMLGADAIVGGSQGLAVGAAYGARLLGRDSVVVCFFGDGAANEGSFHEASNLASILDAPVVFVCENNQWALSTPTVSTMRVANIADRAAAYGFPGVTVDGNDVIAMRDAARTAVERARAGDGPTLLEAKTYRMTPHSAFATGATSTEEELAAWRLKDPIDRLENLLLTLGSNESRLEALGARAQAAIDDATQSALEAPVPAPETALDDVYVYDQGIREGLLA